MIEQPQQNKATQRMANLDLAGRRRVSVMAGGNQWKGLPPSLSGWVVGLWPRLNMMSARVKFGHTAQAAWRLSSGPIGTKNLLATEGAIAYNQNRR